MPKSINASKRIRKKYKTLQKDPKGQYRFYRVTVYADGSRKRNLVDDQRKIPPSYAEQINSQLHLQQHAQRKAWGSLTQ